MKSTPKLKKAIGAKVNGRIGPQIPNFGLGDQVEIINNANSFVRVRDWLTLVKTSKARNNRQFFKIKTRNCRLTVVSDLLMAQFHEYDLQPQVHG